MWSAKRWSLTKTVSSKEGGGFVKEMALNQNFFKIHSEVLFHIPFYKNRWFWPLSWYFLKHFRDIANLKYPSTLLQGYSRIHDSCLLYDHQTFRIHRASWCLQSHKKTWSEIYCGRSFVKRILLKIYEKAYRTYSVVHHNSTLDRRTGAIFSVFIQLLKSYKMVMKYEGKKSALGIF